MHSKPLTATLLTLAVSMAITTTARAIADADNLGQWNKPTKIGPDQAKLRIQGVKGKPQP